MHEDRRPWGLLAIASFFGLSLLLRAWLPAPPPTLEVAAVPSVVSAEPLDPDWAALVEGRPVDVNHAPAALLRQLPGVGPKLSERIVEARRTRGAFRSARDLEAVHGLGARSVQKLSRHIVFGTRPVENTRQPKQGLHGRAVLDEVQAEAEVEAELPVGRATHR